MCITKAVNGIGVKFYNSIQFHKWAGLCMPANSLCTFVICGSKAKYISELERPIMVENFKLYGIKL